jgi:ABC-type sugar transport system ATPase subunit
VLDVDIEVDRREFTVAARLSVAPGEKLALFGPSGAGKTTVLEAIAGLVPLRRGRIAVAGRTLTRTERPRRSVPPWRRRVGLLRQQPALFPHLSVRQNLGYAPGAAARVTEMADLARQLGIEGLLDARPAALSGGQAHRVALARLLLARCDALLLDEPYTGLDPGSRRQLTALLRDLVSARHVPAVLVAHELAEAQAFADQIAVLDRGAVVQVAPPDEVVLRPASRRVAELVGYRGFVPVAAAGPPPSAAAAGEPGNGVRRGPAGGPASGAAAAMPVAGVHPERVRTGAHPGDGIVLSGPVLASRASGAAWEADISVGGIVVCCRFPGRPPGVGERLTFTAVGAPVFGDGGRLVRHAEEVWA